MRRRLDLAASLVGNPSILYLDEPTTGLDPHARNGVWDTIRNLVLDGTTVLLTTQYLEEADALADSLMVFDKGRVVAVGPSGRAQGPGGQAVARRPAGRARTPRTRRRDRRRAVGTRPTVDVVNALVSVPVTDGTSMPVVVRRLDEAGIAVTELALRLPSLDEVFLALTGHAAEEQHTAVLEGAGR